MNETETIQKIELKKIKPCKMQPRKRFNENGLSQLSESIRIKGVIQPLLGRPDWCIGKNEADILKVNGSAPAQFFEIVDGERRYRAALRLKLEAVPLIVRNLSDQESFIIQLIEGLQHEDLTPIEEAEGYERALAFRDAAGKPVYTMELLSKETGIDRKTIYGKLKLLKLPELASKAVEEGTIGEYVGELIGRLPSPEMREQAAKGIIKPDFQEQPMNRRQAQQFIQENFARELKGAPFDQRDAVLVPAITDEATGERLGGGACPDCPMRSGNSPELLGDVRRPDICMNPSCYAAKCDALWKGFEATASAEGKKVLSAKETGEIMEANGVLKYGSEYVDLREHVVTNDNAKAYTWRQILDRCTSKPQIVVARDGRGKIRELVKRSLVMEAETLAAKERGEPSIFAAKSGKGAGSSTRSASNGGPSPAEIKRRDETKLQFQTTLKLVEALVGAIDKKGTAAKDNRGSFWDEMIDLAVVHAGYDGCWLVCKRLGLEPKPDKANRNAKDAEGVREYGLALDGEEYKPGLVVELLLSKQLKWHGAQGDRHFRRMAEIYGVDATAVSKAIASETKEKPVVMSAKNIPGAGKTKLAKIAMIKLKPVAHAWEKIAGTKYRCKGCGASAVKHKGKMLEEKAVRGKPCSRSEVMAKLSRGPWKGRKLSKANARTLKSKKKKRQRKD